MSESGHPGCLTRRTSWGPGQVTGDRTTGRGGLPGLRDPVKTRRVLVRPQTVPLYFPAPPSFLALVGHLTRGPTLLPDPRV